MEQKYSKEELETAIRDAIEKEVPQWKTKVEEHAKTENELREQLKVAGVFQSKVEGLVTQVKKEQEQNSELQMQIEILSSYAA
jgi:ribosome-binding ATPase YchF (GTP1/OBG family)